MTMAVTTTSSTNAGWELLDTIVGALLGSLMLAGLFAWVLVDSFQPDRLPVTPLPLRVLLAMIVWTAVAAALASLRPDGGWRWGIRLSLPAIVVLGFLALNNSGGLWPQLLAFLLMTIACGCAGGVLGERVQRS